MEISRATRARASETCWPGGLIGPLRSTSFDAWALDQDSALIEMQSEVIARFENRIARLEASVSTGSVLNLTPRATAPDFLWWHPRLQWLCRSAQAPVISSLETPPPPQKKAVPHASKPTSEPTVEPTATLWQTIRNYGKSPFFFMGKSSIVHVYLPFSIGNC